MFFWLSSLKNSEADSVVKFKEVLNKIINGKFYAESLLKEIYPLSIEYIEKYKRKPSLAVILLGADSASLIYVKNKIRTAENNNIESIEIPLSIAISERIAVSYTHLTLPTNREV